MQITIGYGKNKRELIIREVCRNTCCMLPAKRQSQIINYQGFALRVYYAMDHLWRFGFKPITKGGQSRS